MHRLGCSYRVCEALSRSPPPIFLLHPGTRFFCKQHFYKQRQAETGKKIKQKLNKTLRLNFCYLKIIRSLHPRYQPKITGDILKTVQKPSASVLMRLYD